jgi:cytochrome c oxidase subunit I
MIFLKTGLVRGIIAQIVGTLLGMGFTMGIRAMEGKPAWDAEPVSVVGAIVGAVAFMFGVGVLSDWVKWARGIPTKDHPEHDPDMPLWARYFGADYDHKVIGVQYGVTSFLLLGLGGTFAILFRIELAKSGIEFLSNPIFEILFGHSGADIYNTFMSLHGMVMIGAILLSIGAVSNYLVPLLIGAKDMAFPRLNAFAFWISIPGAIILTSSLFLGGFDTGWTGYPPLSIRAPIGIQMFLFGVYLIGLSSITGSINVIVTVLRMRTPGMSMFKMPIFVWAAFATALIQFTATQLIGLSFQLVMLQRLLAMPFFDATNGGNPILFQHLFWFYSHPAVYIFVLPGLGIISELLPVFTRKPLFGYRWIAFSSLGIALVGFFVWAHHMFTSGMSAYLRVPFMYSTLLVAVPTGVKFFSWTATIWRGKLRLKTPMLYVLGGIVVFLLGGLTGPPNATVATDLHLHDTYYIVGHFHDTMFGGFLFPFLAAMYFWYPKVSGRMYNEFWGKVSFILLFPSFLVMSTAQMWIGLLGMRRRIADYDPALGFDVTQMVITIAGELVALAVFIAMLNFFVSAYRGKKAPDNPWNSRSPEWLISSPPPLHNYESPLEVVGNPYDYGLKDSVYVKLGTAPTQQQAEH